MTDTPPDEVLIEAARRLGLIWKTIDDLREMYRDPCLTHRQALRAMADTLVELGWKPPVDPLLVEAREIAAKAMDESDDVKLAEICRAGNCDDSIFVQTALAGIRRGMEIKHD